MGRNLPTPGTRRLELGAGRDVPQNVFHEVVEVGSRLLVTDQYHRASSHRDIFDWSHICWREKKRRWVDKLLACTVLESCEQELIGREVDACIGVQLGVEMLS